PADRAPRDPVDPEPAAGDGPAGRLRRSARAARAALRDLRAARPDATSAVWARRGAFAVVAAGLVGLLVVGPSTAPRPTLVPPGTVLPAPGFPEFGQVSVAVAAGVGLPTQPRAHCFLLASTERQRERGLMGVRSLQRYAGMAYTFPAPTSDVFYMADTPMPLTVAWFRADGRFIASADMVPCPAGTTHCPFTAAPGPYSSAIEVPRGHLAGLGIGPGALVQLGGPCIGS
ncbi:MAG TPA: DUF192 domain-containing protein, partial [Acidimicrobiales bacterium]|nr:DUF192 domain-containing protein [Acidimicrobiales bacterium]